MKRISVLILALVVSLSAFSVCAASEAEFQMSAVLEYTSDGAYATVSGITPALYNQKINVVLYDPAFSNGLEDLREEDGSIASDPATKKPIAAVANILRIGETFATSEGEYSISLSLEDIPNGQYIIVKVSGGGKVDVEASQLLYYETENNINNITIPAFEQADAQTLGELLREKQYLLGIELDEDYQANKDKIHEMFISVRDNDYKIDSVTGRKFDNLSDVTDVLKRVSALRFLSEDTDSAKVKAFINSYSDLIDYDFSTNNEHFTLVKDEAYKIAAGMFKEEAPCSMSDVNEIVEQSVAVALINTKDKTTITPVIEKYAAILGIDSVDYGIYCEKYTAYEVNKAFVGMNFKTTADVAKAFRDCIAVLEENESSGSSDSGALGGSGGGSSGGFSGGSSSGGSTGAKNIFGVNDNLISSGKEKDEQQGVYYTDMTDSHWAYESVKTLSAKKVVEGYPDGSFMPDKSVTREQFVKMLVTAFGLDEVSAAALFTDVDSSRWSASYIKAAVEAGIVSGYPDGSFMPAKEVSRQDAAVMLARACKLAGIELADRKELSDSQEISEYALESVENLVAAGIVTGFEDGSYRPFEKLTRAQAVKLICGLSEK